MISLREVQKLAYEQQVPEQSVERDYILTWMLAELSRHHLLGTAAILKGGTALKKLYFPEWRYSEDLDFTLKTPWTVEAMTTALGEVCLACLPAAGFEVNLATEEPHYDGNQLRSMTVYIAYIGPLRRTRRPRELKLDFTADEVIVAKPVKRPLQRMYSEMNLALTKNIFEAKCRFKGIATKGWDDFLTAQKVEKYQAAWERRLANQVKGLSPLKTVVREMKQLLRTHVG